MSSCILTWPIASVCCYMDASKRSSAWNRTENLGKKLDTFQTSCLRKMLDIKNQDHITNKSISDAVNCRKRPLSTDLSSKDG